MLNANLHFSGRFVSQGILNKTTYTFIFRLVPAVGVEREAFQLEEEEYYLNQLRQLKGLET